MRRLHVVTRGMRIGARDDVHVERTAARDESTEGIGITKPGTAMVQRHVGRIVRDDSACTQRRRVRVQALEVIEPEMRIESSGIVLDERELYPAHGPVEPTVRRVRPARQGLRKSGAALETHAERCHRSGPGRNLQEVPSRQHAQILLEREKHQTSCATYVQRTVAEALDARYAAGAG